MAYLLVIGLVALVLGMGLSGYSKHQMKKERDFTDQQRHLQGLSRIIILAGTVITLVSGISVISNYVSTQKAIQAALPVVELSETKQTLENGKADITFKVSPNSGVKIKSDNDHIEDVIIKSEDLAQEVTVTFVLPGKYEVEGKRSGKTEKQEIVIEPVEYSAVEVATDQAAAETPAE